MQKTALIAIVGPTAAGKSDIAVSLARALGGEIISADSRQVYRGLDVGSGKITKEEMRGIPHHLLDISDPKKQFTVVDFQKHAKRAIRNITKHKKIPIVCGGTALYVDSLLYDVRFPSAPVIPSLRKTLERLGAKKLFAILQKKDPRRAKTIDPDNRHRLIRALEIAHSMGRISEINAPILSANAKAGKWQSSYEPIIIGIRRKPDELRARIDRRLKKRLPGIIREIYKLRAKKVSWERLESFGLEYRWGALFIQKKMPGYAYENPVQSGIRIAGFRSADIDALYSALRAKIWQYAKRQITWLKRNPNIVWVKDGREALRVASRGTKRPL